MDGEHILALGNLVKAGGVLGNAWRRRFCVLRRLAPAGGAPSGSAALQVPLGTLTYFTSSRDAAPRGVLPISVGTLRTARVCWPPCARTASSLAPPPHETEQLEEEEEPLPAGARDLPLVFSFRAKGRRFFLQAADEAELRMWLAALAALVPQGVQVPAQLIV